jgi:inosine/xanthosine triphosphatase
MRVGVGSGNPVKRRAVEQVLESSRGVDLADEVAGDPTTVAVESVPVPSGVSEQPTGHAETVAGAENRAEAVLDASEYDLAVGIEGGVAGFDGTDGLFLVMWAAVSDGSRTGRGAGPSLALPDDIDARIAGGEELGPVMDDVLDASGVARRGGAAGALTAGRVDRADALATAVAGALGPFVTDLY